MLNYTQQQILEAYLTILLEDDDYLQLHPTNAIHVLKSIIDDTEFKTHKQLLKQLNMLDTCVQLRSVLKHECPQNVNQALDTTNGYVTYRDFNGNRKTEKRGLLGLTAKNDSTAEPVTKRDVVKFITDCIEREINFHNRTIKREQRSNSMEKQFLGTSSSTSEESIQECVDYSDASTTGKLWTVLDELDSFSESSGVLSEYYETVLKATFTASQAINFQTTLAELKKKAQSSDDEEAKMKHLLLQFAQYFIQYFCMKEYEVKSWNNILRQLKLYSEMEQHKNYLGNMTLLTTFHRGICYEHLGVFDEAISDYDAILSKDSTFTIAYFNRGRCYYELGRIKESKDDLDNCIIMNPTFPEAHYFHGLCYKKQKKYDKAIRDLSKAIELDDQESKYFTARGQCYSEIKEYTKALEDFEEALKTNKSDAKIYFGRGMCYKHVGAYTQAISDLSSSIDLDPRCKDAYYARGSCYVAEENYTKAITDWTVVINLNPKDTSARYWRGICYYRAETYEQARADFAYVVEHDSLNARAFNYLGCCYSLKHRYDEAITNFEAAINLDPTLARAYYNLARCYYNKGELNKTLELYNKSIRLDPAHANSYGGRAQVYDRLGDPTAALKDIKQALMISPRNEVFRRYKAKFESKNPKRGWLKKTVKNLNPLKRKATSN